MILNQFFLVFGFVVVLVWFITRPASMRVRAWKRLVVVGFLLVAIAAVIFPRLMDDSAEWVGVSSGANLLIYMLAIALVAFAVNQYVHNRDAHERVVTLVRRVAILEAQERLRAGEASRSSRPEPDDQ